MKNREGADFAIDSAATSVLAVSYTHLGGVAKAIVPFGGAGRKAAELIAARTDIPGFGDHLDRREGGFLSDRVKKSSLTVVTMFFAAQGLSLIHI